MTEATRLAPSPTGALHLGNARTFLVNWALARRRGWRIILRIEDLDGPRIKPGAGAATIDILRWLGMDWDEGPIVQSADPEPHRRAMRTLAGRGLVYPSELTRREVEAAASAPQEGVSEARFDASMRPGAIGKREFDREAANWRLVVAPGAVRFVDRFGGEQSRDVSESVGDFVVWTRSGQPAYQLAVVVDDHRQGVTQIVRGDDLLDSAARQLLLYRALSLAPEPMYTHLPLVRGNDGRRLAKRHGDTRLSSYRAAGVPPERIVGLLGAWSGVPDRPAPMSAQDFAGSFELARMSAQDVVFTPEDHRWLMQGRRPGPLSARGVGPSRGC